MELLGSLNKLDRKFESIFWKKKKEFGNFFCEIEIF